LKQIGAQGGGLSGYSIDLEGESFLAIAENGWQDVSWRDPRKDSAKLDRYGRERKGHCRQKIGSAK
jgi:hypothetical protein